MSARTSSATELPAHFVPFSLARAADEVPRDSVWLHEHKLDGYRIQAVVRDNAVQLFTRNAHEWSDRFTQVASDLAELPVASATLDGEIVAVDGDGATSFQHLQQRLDIGSTVGVRYHVFDLLTVDGIDFRREPLSVRREALRALLRYRPRTTVIRATPTFAASKGDPLQQARDGGIEGVISKRLDGPYVSGRNGGWLKVKAGRRQEMVVVGFTDPEGAREGFGALLLGVYDASGSLHYAGKVGTGFDRATLHRLRRRLDTLTARKPGIEERSGIPVGPTHWVKPVLVVEVAFHEWTNDHVLRQPVFKGVREDKDAKLVTREA